MDMKRMRPISASAPAQSADAKMTVPARLSYLPSVLAMGLALGLILTTAKRAASASVDDDRKTVAALDTEYQAAVKRNDAMTMARILADDFVLVTGSGKTFTKADMLEDARRGDIYQQNDEEVQTVRVWGDTAVVTAKLWEKYTSNGKSFDHKFWFSDTYVRTRAGWKYVFGQSSLPLPNSGQ
jgi:uncharacterized protein (TIGR02246 family)